MAAGSSPLFMSSPTHAPADDIAVGKVRASR